MRKTWIRLLCCWLTLLGTGCGFNLKGSIDIPVEFTPVSIQAPDSSHVAKTLKEALRINAIDYTDDTKVAKLVIRILDEAHTDRVTAVNSYGKVIGSELHYRVVFEGVNHEDTVLLERQTIDIARDYVNPELEVLGKSEEAEMIRRDFELDMANRILRRLKPQLRQL